MATKLNIPLPSKGLVVDRPAEYADARSAASMRNMEINRNVLRKRLGSIALGATLGERIMRYFELQVGSVTRLIRVGLTKVEEYDQTSNAWTSVTSTPLAGSTDDTVDFAFPLLAGQKIAVFTNGSDAIRKLSITGNDAALGGTPPKAKYMQAFGPYLVLAYITDAGDTFYSRVQWCDTGDPENWNPVGSDAGSVDLLEDPEDITGMGVFGRSLTIHKANAIYVGQLVTTSDVFQFDRKPTGVGAAAGATIANIPSGEQIFLAADGIHLFNGITAPLIDSPIQEELRETMNPQYLYTSCAIFVEELDEYWVAVPIGNETRPTTIFKYNWRTKQIYKDDRPGNITLGLYLNQDNLLWSDFPVPFNSVTTRWNSRVLSSLNPVPIFGDSAGVSLKRTAISNDDGATAVDGYTDTKDFVAEDLGIPDIDAMMRWKGIELWAKGNSLKVYYSTDSGGSWNPITTLTLAADYPSDDAPLNVYFDVVSSKIRFRFRNNTAGQTFDLKKYQLEASQREARK